MVSWRRGSGSLMLFHVPLQYNGPGTLLHLARDR